MLRGITAAVGGLTSRFRSIVASADRDAEIALLGERAQRPDAWRLAEFLAVRFGADTVIDIRCGQVRRQSVREGKTSIRALDPPQSESGLESLPHVSWIRAEIDRTRDLDRDLATLERSVVICSSADRRQLLPARALERLSHLSRWARAVIITVPAVGCARNAVGVDLGERVPRESGARTGEFELCLRCCGIVPTFIGLASNGEQRMAKDTLLAVVDHCMLEHGRSVPADFRPLAIVGTYNDADIAPQTISKLLSDGIDVHVLDNWSTDGTYEQIASLQNRVLGVSIERFPLDGATEYHEWHRMLSKKEQIAARHPGRWIIHHDSDEIRCSPWDGISLGGGLHIVERMGFTAVDFTVCNFRPVDDHYAAGMNLETQMRRFEFGTHPGHFVQVKAWRQGTQCVDLAGSAGHEVRFANRRIFPYKFILKHYPLRNPDQSRRKVFLERKERIAPHLRARGWHTQYDMWKPDDQFIWDPTDLIEFEKRETRWRYLTELIAGIGIVRD